MEQDQLLRHVADAAPPGADIDFLQRHPVYHNLAPIRLVETEQQIGQRGLA